MIGIGARRAIAADQAIDQPGVECLQRLPVYPVVLALAVAGQVGQEHVDPLDQTVHCRAPSLRLEVES